MKQYHASPLHTWPYASNEDLEKWSTDPDCIEKDIAARFLEERRAKLATMEVKRAETRAIKRAELQDNPFDPRTEVSADAKHIADKVVKHLWIIFVLLPLVLAVLWSLLK